MTSIAKEKIIEVKSKKNTQSNTDNIKASVKDSNGRSYATGKRKNAIAKVWIKQGNGKLSINSKEPQQYFDREISVNIAKAPLLATKNTDKFDIIATIIGGGKSGQAGALSHGISKALVLFDPTNHSTLRNSGFLTRDSRVVERKKYGLKKARKGQTYRKR
jgi:small subunit ribosomal protein S9